MHSLRIMISLSKLEHKSIAFLNNFWEYKNKKIVFSSAGQLAKILNPLYLPP